MVGVKVGHGVRVARGWAITRPRTPLGMEARFSTIQPQLVNVTRLAITRMLINSLQSLGGTS